MVLWIIIGVFLLIILVLAWIIFIPVILFADTASHRYSVHQLLTFSLAFTPKDSQWIRFKIFGINVSSVQAKEKARPKKKEKKETKQKAKPLASYVRLFKRSLKSLTIKKLVIDLDSGDVVANAKLYPLAILVSNGRNSQMHINFQGQVYAHLEAELRLYVVVGAFIKHLFNF